MPSSQGIDDDIKFYNKDYDKDNAAGFPTISPSTGSDASPSTTSHTNDPHTVSNKEAQEYYYTLPSAPRLIYRTRKEESLANGPRVFHRKIYPVFGHPLADLWNDGLWQDVVKAMDTHRILFTTMEVVKFKLKQITWDGEEVEGPIFSPVTIWVGAPENTLPTNAHNAAQEVLALLEKHNIRDVNIEFRESYYHSQANLQLFPPPLSRVDALVDVIGPLTPSLGLGISAVAKPDSQGSMCVYLNEGGTSDRLLGLTCRHVLFGPDEPNNYIDHPSGPSQNILLLGQKAYNNLEMSIKLEIGYLHNKIEFWKENIAVIEQRMWSTGSDESNRKDQKSLLDFKWSIEKAMRDMDKLIMFQGQVANDWSNKDNLVFGRILHSPPISLGVGEHQFTEDWAIFEVDRNKLGKGFQGNKLDLGTDPINFMHKCSLHPEAYKKFEYPWDRLLTVHDVLSNELMRHPDMKDCDGEPCLPVLKHGSSTGTTIGRANGVFSVVRKYKARGMAIEGTSLEWGIIDFDSKSAGFSAGFSEDGDSGSAIVDIQGRIGGKLIGSTSSNKFPDSDMTYATPFWWVLERVKASGFPNAHLTVVE